MGILYGRYGIEVIYAFTNYRINGKIEVGAQGVDVPQLFTIAVGFDMELTQANMHKMFVHLGETAGSSHLKSFDKKGNDIMAEITNLFFIATHGSNQNSDRSIGRRGKATLLFDSKNDEWVAFSEDWKLGDLDIFGKDNHLMWLVIYSCDTIDHRNFAADYHNIFDGLHLMLGTHGVGEEASDLGDFDLGNMLDDGRDFAENILDGETIASAWLSALSTPGYRIFPSILSAESHSTWNEGNIDWSKSTMNNDRYPSPYTLPLKILFNWPWGPVESINHKDLFWMGLKWID